MAKRGFFCRSNMQNLSAESGHQMKSLPQNHIANRKCLQTSWKEEGERTMHILLQQHCTHYSSTAPGTKAAMNRRDCSDQWADKYQWAPQASPKGPRHSSHLENPHSSTWVCNQLEPCQLCSPAPRAALVGRKCMASLQLHVLYLLREGIMAFC